MRVERKAHVLKFNRYGGFSEHSTNMDAHAEFVLNETILLVSNVFCIYCTSTMQRPLYPSKAEIFGLTSVTLKYTNPKLDSHDFHKTELLLQGILNPKLFPK